jgi:hypothetical protein
MIQEGGKRRKSKVSRKSSKKSSRRSVSRKSSRKSKASRKSSRKSSRKASRRSKASRKSSRKSSRKASRRSKASRKSSKKASKKGSKKARRAANPQITVRGALIKYVWANLDVKKEAASKGMKPIGLPAKIVQMAFVEAQKSHPMKESDKQSAPYWEGVKKTAMKLLADNLKKYSAAAK